MVLSAFLTKSIVVCGTYFYMQMKSPVMAACGILILSGAVLFSSCSKSKGHAVKVLGSTSIQPFAEMLSQSFNASSKDAYVEVDGGGSTAGLKGVADGYADVGMCSRQLKAGEDFKEYTIALDGIAVVLNQHNPVQNLTLTQIRMMFTGQIKNWKAVGGPDMPVRLITREEGSGTREAFTTLVMEKEMAKEISKQKAGYKDPATMPVEVKEKIDKLHRERPRITLRSITEPSNGSVKALVEGDVAAIGYMSLGQVEGDHVKAITVDGVMPTVETVTSGKYPLVRPFLFVVKDKPTPQAKQFIDYVLSDVGQRMLENAGLIRAPKTHDK